MRKHIDRFEDSFDRVVRSCLLGVAVLFICTGCARGDELEVIALIKEHVSPTSIKMSVDADGVEQITYLNIPNKRDALEILPHLDQLDHLRTLKIAYSDLTDDDLKKLPPMPNLKMFATASPKITDDGLEHLASMRSLQHLRLRRTDVRGPGLAHLQDAKELQWLEMGLTPLDDRAILHIVANFKKLRRFDFDGTKVTQEGIIKLAELPWLLTIAMPKEAFHGDKAARQAARREFCLKYIETYKKSKAKARAAGIDVPDERQTPFGGIE